MRQQIKKILGISVVAFAFSLLGLGVKAQAAMTIDELRAEIIAARSLENEQVMNIVYPFNWGDGLQTVDFEGKSVRIDNGIVIPANIILTNVGTVMLEDNATLTVKGEIYHETTAGVHPSGVSYNGFGHEYKGNIIVDGTDGHGIICQNAANTFSLGRPGAYSTVSIDAEGTMPIPAATLTIQNGGSFIQGTPFSPKGVFDISEYSKVSVKTRGTFLASQINMTGGILEVDETAVLASNICSFNYNYSEDNVTYNYIVGKLPNSNSRFYNVYGTSNLCWDCDNFPNGFQFYNEERGKVVFGGNKTYNIADYSLKLRGVVLPGSTVNVKVWKKSEADTWRCEPGGTLNITYDLDDVSGGPGQRPDPTPGPGEDAPMPTPAPTDNSNVSMPAIGAVSTSAQGTATVTSASTDAKIVIPDEISVGGVSYKVTAIAGNAYKNNKTIKSLAIGNNVTTIGANAFSGCKNLSSAKFGKGVTTIGANAFKNCSKLSKVTIQSKTLTKVAKTAFKGIKKKATITVPKAYKKNKKVNKQLLAAAKAAGAKLRYK